METQFHSPPAEEPDHEYLVGDVSSEGDVAAAMDGVVAVIHLAGDPRPEAPWDSVLETTSTGRTRSSRRPSTQGVEKFASHPRTTLLARTRRTSERPRCIARTTGSDWTEPNSRTGNLYGVSKATGEVLGRYYYDEHGLSVVTSVSATSRGATRR